MAASDDALQTWTRVRCHCKVTVILAVAWDRHRYVRISGLGDN